jgi:hypothetical protein
MSLTAPYLDRTVPSTPSDTSGRRLAIRTLLVPILVVLTRTFDISLFVCRYSTCRLVEWSTSLHSSIVLRLYLHMSLSSVDLHRCNFLIINTYFSINPFMNLINRNACVLEIKSIYDRILPFMYFECPPLKLTNKNTTRKLP